MRYALDAFFTALLFTPWICAALLIVLAVSGAVHARLRTKYLLADEETRLRVLDGGRE